MGERFLGLSIAVALVTVAGCEGDRPPTGLDVDAGPACDLEPLPSVEGDVDGDGIPNDEDDDADGDGIENLLEHVGGLDCAGSDVDGDGIDNWLDADSDDDGVPDANEGDLGTSPYAADSDGDGESDLVEAASGSSPVDGTNVPRAHERMVITPGEDQSLTIDFVNRIENADVFFLVDTTGSMGGERDNLVMGLGSVIVPGIAEAIPNVHFGLGGLEDYPVGDFGGGGDRPFYLLSTMIPSDRDVGAWSESRISGAANGTPDLIDSLDGLQIGSGNDLPEAFVPALWATATGSGLPWGSGGVSAQTSCAAGTQGYPCFRDEALPVIILVGDASFHNGPDGAEPYSIEAPSYDEAVEALGEIGAKVVGVYSGGGTGLSDFVQVATDTGALAPDGTPMVFEISEDGTGLDTSVVDAVASLAEGRTQDITGNPESGGSFPADLDVGRVLRSFATGEADTYESKDETTFYQLEKGSNFSFDVVIGADEAPAVGAEAHLIQFEAIDEGGATFATRRILVVVAPEGRTIVFP